MSVFPSLKCFTHCLTLLVTTQVSLCACLSHGNIQCGNFLNDIVSLHIAATARPNPPFFALKYVLVMGAGNVIYMLVQESRWNLSSYIVHCNIALTFAHNSTMFMTFGMTFVVTAVCEG